VIVHKWAHIDGLDVDGRGQEVDDGVEHRLDALVLEGGAAEHREKVHFQCALADEAPQRCRVGLLALKVALDPVVVLLHRRLHELVAPLLHHNVLMSPQPQCVDVCSDLRGDTPTTTHADASATA
jgi:hypothetical protein